MKEVTILEAEYNELKACHTMLGQISMYVEDFCSEDDTTLIGVLKLLEKYYFLKSEEMAHNYESLKEHESN